MEKIWKPIKNYENNYIISNYGEIKNIQTGKILKGDRNSLGYRRVVLYSPIRKRFFIHRLVAYHFCDGYNPELVVNHKDGNKQNNRADNLEWVTRSQNDLHAYENNLRGVHIAGIKGNIYYRVFDLETNKDIKIYNSGKAFREDYPMGQDCFQRSCKRQWFFKNWHNKKLGKLGLQRINYKSSTTTENIV